MKRVVAAAVVLAAIGLGWSFLRSGDAPPRAGGARSTATVIEPARAPAVRGDSRAPAARDDAPEQAQAPVRERARGPVPEERTVRPEIASQVEANQRSVAEAHESNKYPERLDPKVAPAPFDRAAYRRDPQAYLDVVEPGRVFQTLDDAEGVPPLQAEGPTSAVLEPGAHVRFSIHGPGGAPVTFTSLNGGELDNGLSSITVRFDERGFASVAFTATPNARGDVTLLAGSPLATGQLRFSIKIR